MASDLSQGAGSYQGNVSGGAAFALDDMWNITVLECNKARGCTRLRCRPRHCITTISSDTMRFMLCVDYLSRTDGLLECRVCSWTVLGRPQNVLRAVSVSHADQGCLRADVLCVRHRTAATTRRLRTCLTAAAGHLR